MLVRCSAGGALVGFIQRRCGDLAYEGHEETPGSAGRALRQHAVSEDGGVTSWRLLNGDCMEVLRTFPEASIEACVTDPPYGIGFMGREWDTFKPDVPRKQAERLVKGERIVSDNPNLNGRRRSPAISESQIFYDYSPDGLRRFQTWTADWGREVLRVLKPGGYALVCGAPRAFHRMACGIEDAGFEIRDCLTWLYGQGFPKSLNLGDGVGTALKPGWEPIILARKPFKGSLSRNVENHGTGGLNIDACRLDGTPRETGNREGEPSADRDYSKRGSTNFAMKPGPRGGDEMGRWPANVALDEDAAAMLDEQSGELVSGANPTRRGSDKFRGIYQPFKGQAECDPARGEDSGGASRFYYVAKPSREERDFGIYDLRPRSGGEATDRKDGSAGLNNPRAGAGRTGGARNFHPTVKPVELMRWLVRLVTPSDGTVLDPFAGSGTTGMACRYEHRSFIGIEREAEYIEIAKRRIDAVAPLFSAEAIS